MKLSLLKNLFIAVLAVIFIAGCSYKPATAYAKKEISGNVYVKLIVDLKDPKNSVLIKDAINDLIIQRLDANIVNEKDNADVFMEVRLNNASFSVLQYDKLGYNKVFKTNVSISVSYQKKNQAKKSFNVSGEDTFSIEDGTVISDTKRYESIKTASDDALRNVISKIAALSFKE